MLSLPLISSCDFKDGYVCILSRGFDVSLAVSLAVLAVYILKMGI